MVHCGCGRAREFYAGYRNDGWGTAAYDPAMMVAVLLFAYCLGIRSSRKIARALERDVAFRVVAANQQPDFRTICRFRAQHEEALERLKRLEEARARLEQEVTEEAKTAGEHQAQRREEEARSGQKKRERKPKVTLSIPDREAKANTSDPDSRIMKTHQGYVQGYNVQTVVSQDQVIIAVGVTQEANAGDS